jgi:holo-[acyl-carrier protein] synthase
MAIAIGTDIVEIARIGESVSRQGIKFAQRILSQAELEVYQAKGESVSFLAKRFAAKEAIAKALGTGIGHGVSFQDMVISNNQKGAPEVSLYRGAAEILRSLGASKVLLSISDEKDYALAYAMIL